MYCGTRKLVLRAKALNDRATARTISNITVLSAFSEAVEKRRPAPSPITIIMLFPRPEHCLNTIFKYF